MKEGYKALGEFIRQIDIRNTEGKEDNLLGVSVQKQFIPSIANTVGTDFTKYKVVKKGQFTYIPDTSRRGEKIAIALLQDYEEGLVSNVYTVFEVIDEEKLLPDYLMLWFSRPEFDRYARFKSHGSVREIMDWDEMCKVELPVPSIEKQRSIVKAYKAITDRIELKRRINDNLEQMAKTIYDYWFTQFDFPDENGKPYRSSGGQMVWNEQLKRNIPAGWTVASIVDNPLSSVIKPGVDRFSVKEYLATADVNGTTISKGSTIEYETRESRANMQPEINSVWFAKMKNSVKHLFLNREMQAIIDSAILSTGFCGIQCSDISFEYISSFVSNDFFETAKDILAHGATQEAVNNEDMLSIRLVIPDNGTLQSYHEACKSLYAQMSKNICENRELVAIRDWLLPMLMNGQATVSD